METINYNHKYIKRLYIKSNNRKENKYNITVKLKS